MHHLKVHAAFCGRSLATAGLIMLLSSPFPRTALAAPALKLNSSDAANSDYFGYSVAASGGKALVGAFQAEDAVFNSGAAYLFEASTGQQLLKLAPSDPTAEALFGSSVALGGNLALVGAFQDNDAGNLSGSAYLFNATTGQELFKLAASDAAAGDHFGASAALSGNLALVGADWANSAYLFDTTTGQQLAKLTSGAGGAFGISVALYGNLALVGARNDDGQVSSSGSAYLFDVSTPLAPVLLHKLTASDGAISDAFGTSVSLSGNLALVGSFADDDDGSISGSAYLFDATTGNQLAKFSPDDAAADQWFGYSVSLSGNQAIVGAHSDDEMGSSSGAAYLFDVSDPLSPVQVEKLVATDPAPYTLFGIAVGLSGNTAVVGSYNGSNEAGVASGSAYSFVVPEPGTLPLAAALSAIELFRRRKR